ncbi:MAG TPA: sensor histidine kinase [Candidatus Limnocylindrales bacterium]|jgi:two-component system sensor histidine kinase DegS
MEMGTLGLGRRPDLDALVEAKESVDRALDDLALAVLAAQERERARLADELHDGAAQALANLAMQTEIVERLIAEDPAAARAELVAMRQLLTTELDSLRGYINQLRPPMAESDDLDEALREAASRLTETAGVPVEVSLEAPPAALERGARPAVLRVAQEALRNVGKHAEASRAWLATRVETAAGGAPEWVLEVGDDGRGFDPEQVGRRPSRRHFGLRFMRERSELLGARLTIETKPAAGTVVRLSVSTNGDRRQP